MPKSTKENHEILKKKTSKTTTTKTKKAPTKSTSSVAKVAKKTTRKSSGRSTTSKKEVKTSTTSKASSKKSVTKKKKTSNSANAIEYYDLPYRYNDTVVKLLTQTPTTLFVYWDIADQDRKQFEKCYGETFFADTKPVLVVHNQTKHYSFEVEINDFANSWYLPVNDSNCIYQFELGRRPKQTSGMSADHYVAIASSNSLAAPNDRILFSKLDELTYQNVKTKETKKKSVDDLSDEHSRKQIYTIYDLYQTIYHDENFEDFDGYNPSSSTSSIFS